MINYWGQIRNAFASLLKIAIFSMRKRETWKLIFMTPACFYVSFYGLIKKPKVVVLIFAKKGDF